jgi:hypothetical protein
VPFFILISLLAVAGILVFFDIPQRYCKEIRITELYFQSHFWFQLVLLVLLIEIQISLKNMFKYDDQLLSQKSLDYSKINQK